MAKYVSLRRTKSEHDLPTLKTKNGIKLLADLAERDLPVLQFLNTYILEILDGSYHGNGEFYIRTQQFLSLIEQLYQQSDSNCPYYIISFFRHVITLISEALFLCAISDVCKVAIDDVVVVSPKIRIKFKDLQTTVGIIQDQTLRMELAITQHMKERNDFEPEHFDARSIISQTDNIWKCLRRSEAPLKEVVSAVEEKSTSDATFYQRVSLGIGAVCAGRFLWSLWKGDSPDQVVHAGLWSVCTGMSGAVMQIPRARAQQILDDLARHRVRRQDAMELIKHWLIESDGICAKLVLYTSGGGKH